MAKEYEVVKADHKKDFDGKFGPMSVYSLSLREPSDSSGIVYEAEMVQKQASAPPAPGETLTGDITPNKNPDFPDNFKKEYVGGGSGGGGGGTFKPRDPSEIAGARHAHNLLVAAHSFPPMQGVQGAEPGSDTIQTRLDNLEAFACVLDEKTAAISDVAKSDAKQEPKEGETKIDTSDIPF